MPKEMLPSRRASQGGTVLQGMFNSVRHGLLLTTLVIGACGSDTPSSPSDLGATGGGPGHGGGGGGGAPGGGSSPSRCTSGQYWTGGDHHSPNMHPGGSCIACHTARGGSAPVLQIAGTVYLTAHEPIDCLGESSTAITVQITDSAGMVVSLPVNSSGNFLLKAGALKPPYHAKVIAGNKQRMMGVAQMSGDCNSCHTETGANGAPGRIMAP